MRLNHADDNVGAANDFVARIQKHRIGLSDTGTGAEEDLELSASGFRLFMLDPSERGGGIGL
jgi:hypothetical protein